MACSYWLRAFVHIYQLCARGLELRQRLGNYDLGREAAFKQSLVQIELALDSRPLSVPAARV